MTTKRILVIDDEPNIVKSCTRMLELEGFEVRGVTGGAEAIALYKSEGFDLVLVDLKMPGVDGLEVLAALREYDPSAAVVIVTAYGTKESVVEALRLGACEFLEKPLEAKTLIATVRRILERENGAVVRGNLRTL
ncbi:MAG: response regulator, partial [Anaerolineae bacterium]|nr:response regulator [Anaerolineae bacterium]